MEPSSDLLTLHPGTNAHGQRMMRLDAYPERDTMIVVDDRLYLEVRGPSHCGLELSNLCAEVGDRQADRGRPLALAQVEAGQHSAGEVGPGEVRPVNLRSREIGAGQIGAGEVGPAQVRTDELH